MSAELPPLYDDLQFLSPLSEARADRLARWLADGLADGGTVLDVGCGWGELLLRVAAAAPLSLAVGIDLEPDRIGEAQRRAREREVASRTTFTAADAATSAPAPVDALIAIGASQIWAPDAGPAQALDYGAALTAMRATVRPGARLVYGEGIWSRPPTPAATTPLSGRDDEFVMLPDLVDLAVAHRFEAIAVHEAGLDEWDEFESGFCARYATWLATHPADHPDAEEFRRRVEGQRAAYLRGYRGTLGMAYLQLLAT